MKSRIIELIEHIESQLNELGHWQTEMSVELTKCSYSADTINYHYTQCAKKIRNALCKIMKQVAKL